RGAGHTRGWASRACRARKVRRDRGHRSVKVVDEEHRRRTAIADCPETELACRHGHAGVAVGRCSIVLANAAPVRRAVPMLEVDPIRDQCRPDLPERADTEAVCIRGVTEERELHDPFPDEYRRTVEQGEWSETDRGMT